MLLGLPVLAVVPRVLLTQARHRKHLRMQHEFKTLLLTRIDDYRLDHIVDMLFDQGWRARHVPLVDELAPDLPREPFEEVIVGLLIGMAHKPGLLPGPTVDHQIAWMAPLIGTNLLGRSVPIILPPPYGPITYQITLTGLIKALAPLHAWPMQMNPDLAPLAYAAGLTLSEAKAADVTGTLDADSLQVLASLRSARFPTVRPALHQ